MSAAVEQALADLYERDDKLTAAAVVDAALDPSSPLHSCFEWDDSLAAHQYRLVQARRLIASVRIPAAEGGPTRAYVHVESLGSYEPADQVARAVDLRAEVMRGYRRDLARLRERLVRFVEFAGVVAAIDDVLGEEG